MKKPKNQQNNPIKNECKRKHRRHSECIGSIAIKKRKKLSTLSTEPMLLLLLPFFVFRTSFFHIRNKNVRLLVFHFFQMNNLQYIKNARAHAGKNRKYLQTKWMQTNIKPIAKIATATTTIIIMCWISLLFSWVLHASFVIALVAAAAAARRVCCRECSFHYFSCIYFLSP